MAQLRAEAFGFIFQQTHLVSNLTLFENVAVAGYAAKAGSVREIRETADRLLFKMNARDAKDRLPSQVSGGEAQRAAIARAMIGNPSLIFADVKWSMVLIVYRVYSVQKKRKKGTRYTNRA